MRALLLLFLLVASCKAREEQKPSAPPPEPQTTGTMSPGAFIPGHVIVKAKGGGPLAPEVLARHGLVKLKDLSGGPTLYRVEGLDAGAPDARARTQAIVDELRKDPNVEYAQLDHVLTFQ